MFNINSCHLAGVDLMILQYLRTEQYITWYNTQIPFKFSKTGVESFLIPFLFQLMKFQSSSAFCAELKLFLIEKSDIFFFDSVIQILLETYHQPIYFPLFANKACFDFQPISWKDLSDGFSVKFSFILDFFYLKTFHSPFQFFALHDTPYGEFHFISIIFAFVN
jgi:hypothetical protein